VRAPIRGGSWLLVQYCWLVLLTSAHRRSSDLAGSWPSAFFSAFSVCASPRGSLITGRRGHHIGFFWGMLPPLAYPWIVNPFDPPIAIAESTATAGPS
jgi:hypothetical protein